MAPVMGVPTIMRDVTLWAFTQDFFEQREAMLKEVEAALAALDQPVDAYLAQLHAIEVHDTTARLARIQTPTLVLADESDILIPTGLSRRLCGGIPGAQWAVSKGGHAFLWEHPKPFNAAVLGLIGQHRRPSGA
jgi:3-oxoadipate enol-lactonase